MDEVRHEGYGNWDWFINPLLNHGYSMDLFTFFISGDCGSNEHDTNEEDDENEEDEKRAITFEMYHGRRNFDLRCDYISLRDADVQ